MSRIILSDQAKARWVPRIVPSLEERIPAFENYKALLKEYDSALNSFGRDVDGSMHPAFPVAYEDGAYRGYEYVRITGMRSRIELANERDGLSLTLYVTNQPRAVVSSPFTHCLVFNEVTAVFPQELVDGKNGVDRPWNFQHAAIAMAVCESAAAEKENYHGWPGYGAAKDSVRYMPDGLKPDVSKNRIAVNGADGVLLTDLLQRLGKIRAEAKRQFGVSRQGMRQEI